MAAARLLMLLLPGSAFAQFMAPMQMQIFGGDPGSSGPFSSGSVVSQSTSSSWVQGADGRMHEEVRKVSERQAGDGSLEKTAVACVDGRCKGVVQHSQPAVGSAFAVPVGSLVSAEGGPDTVVLGDAGAGGGFGGDGLGQIGDAVAEMTRMGSMLMEGAVRQMAGGRAGRAKNLLGRARGGGGGAIFAVQNDGRGSPVGLQLGDGVVMLGEPEGAAMPVGPAADEEKPAQAAKMLKKPPAHAKAAAVATKEV